MRTPPSPHVKTSSTARTRSASATSRHRGHQAHRPHRDMGRIETSPRPKRRVRQTHRHIGRIAHIETSRHQARRARRRIRRHRRIGASRHRTHKGRLRPLIDIGRCRPSRRLRSRHGSFTRSCSSPLSIIRRRWRITTSRTWSRRSAKCEAAGGAAKRLQRRRTPTQAPSEPRPGFPLSYLSARGVNLYSSYRKIKWSRRPNKPDSIPTSVSKRR